MDPGEKLYHFIMDWIGLFSVQTVSGIKGSVELKSAKISL